MKVRDEEVMNKGLGRLYARKSAMLIIKIINIAVSMSAGFQEGSQQNRRRWNMEYFTGVTASNELRLLNKEGMFQ
ncbi:MAG: hypothetical protein ACOYOS_21490 [Syntrophales bacterium]